MHRAKQQGPLLSPGLCAAGQPEEALRIGRQLETGSFAMAASLPQPVLQPQQDAAQQREQPDVYSIDDADAGAWPGLDAALAGLGQAPEQEGDDAHPGDGVWRSARPSRDAFHEPVDGSGQEAGNGAASNGIAGSRQAAGEGSAVVS